jgi:superfamily II DNA or RNA helicase
MSGQLHPAPVLRPYQDASIAAVEGEWAAGTRRTLLVLPTGCGKTVVFAELARREVEAGGRVLVLAHRTELLEQAKNKLAAVGCWAQLEQGKNRAGLAPVVVASVQTMHPKRLAKSYSPDRFTLIVVDEAHHATATSYQGVLAYFPNARVLGVTATPDRADGKALAEAFESTAYRYELQQAIADGYLSPIRARRIVVESLDLSSVKTRAGDLAQNELAAVMLVEEVLHGIAGPMLEQAGERRTIVFMPDVATAYALADIVNRYRPGAARAVDGAADETTRKQILRSFSEGSFQFLVNCALFTEGFDEPSIACVAMARPTKSRALFTQCVGRGTRLAPGKADCLVLDFAGNAGKHKLVGPADCLAGKDLDAAQKAEIDALLGTGQLDLEEVMAAADRELERKRAELKVTAIAKYSAREVDPFLGDDLDNEAPLVPATWAHEIATAAQVSALERYGLKDLPESLTRSDATRLLARLDKRRREGLCTYKQCKALKRAGLNPSAITFERANALITILATNSWQPWALQGQPEYDSRFGSQCKAGAA